MQKKTKKILCATGLVLVITVTSIGVYAAKHTTSAEVVTKETTVSTGNLTVGVTESGTVTLGTTEQSFSLDT